MKGELNAVDARVPLEETTCCVCLELLQAPRVLSCGHPVCLQCTERITSITIFNNNNIDNNINIKTSTNVNDGNNGKPVLRCPQCHSLTKVQDLREAVESPSSPANQLCGYCEAVPATRVCLNCEKPDTLPLCLDCSVLIHKGKMSTHIVADIDSVTKKQRIADRCAVHGKKKKFFCEDDTCSICSDCIGDDHKGHNAVPAHTAAKNLLPNLKERVANLPAVQQEVKSIIMRLDAHINVLLLERTKQEQYLTSAVSAILGTLNEVQGALQQAIVASYEFPELLALRAKAQSQVAIINTFKIGGAKVETFDELEVVRLFCSLPDMSKIEQTSTFPMRAASTVDVEDVVESIRSLQALLVRNFAQPALIVSTRVELDPSKEHVYGVVRIEKGGVLTSSSASALILNAQVLDVQAGGRINLNGKGHAGGVSIPPESNGYAYQGVSPTGGSGPNLYSNGGGGGGGQGGGNFGSTGGGGGGYGTAGSIGATNSHNSKRSNSGGFAGSTYGEPGLAVIHLGSGGGSGHPFSKGVGGKGGNGGGALRVNAWQIINNGTISCNGEDGKPGKAYGSGGGAGSGGSIYLQADKFENNGKLTATGGQGGGINPPAAYPNICTRGGSGGHGRIRVELPKHTAIGDVMPHPYMG